MNGLATLQYCYRTMALNLIMNASEKINGDTEKKRKTLQLP